jgi:hypothetical protein
VIQINSLATAAITLRMCRHIREETMRTYLKWTIAAAVVAGGTGLVASQYWPSAEVISAVRLPDHGNTHNLVGSDWSSPKKHGWDGEIPTANSPQSNAPK